MTVISDIKFTIYFNDTELDPEERDEQAQRLIAELKVMDEIDSIDRVPDSNPPKGNKTLGGFLAGLLETSVKGAANAKTVLGFLGNFLVGKPIELSVEANGKKLTVKAYNPAELEAAVKAAQDFIAS